MTLVVLMYNAVAQPASRWCESFLLREYPLALLPKDGMKFDLYSNFWIFEPFAIIWLNLKFANSQLYKWISFEYFMSSSTTKWVPGLGNLLLSDLIMKMTTNQKCQITPHISYTYTQNRLQNKTTNITKTNKIHKTNSHKTLRQHGVIGGAGRYA